MWVEVCWASTHQEEACSQPFTGIASHVKWLRPRLGVEEGVIVEEGVSSLTHLH